MGWRLMQKKGLVESITHCMPLVGFMYRTYMLAHTLKILGTLVREGIPLKRAVEICADMTTNVRYKHALHKIQLSIAEGSSLSSAWRDSCLSHEEIQSLLMLGESTGRLSHMLLHGAHMIEDRLKKYVRTIIIYLNPALLVISACLIGLFLYGLYIPLVTMSSVLE